MRSALATLISTMVKPPLLSIAIRSARRPLGSGISHTANRSWRQNSRVTPRATSAAIGGASVKHRESGCVAMPEPRTKRGQKESGRAEARPLPAQLFTRLAVEDVVADRRDALQAPAGRNVAG